MLSLSPTADVVADLTKSESLVYRNQSVPLQTLQHLKNMRFSPLMGSTELLATFRNHQSNGDQLQPRRQRVLTEDILLSESRPAKRTRLDCADQPYDTSIAPTICLREGPLFVRLEACQSYQNEQDDCLEILLDSGSLSALRQKIQEILDANQVPHVSSVQLALSDRNGDANEHIEDAHLKEKPPRVSQRGDVDSRSPPTRRTKQLQDKTYNLWREGPSLYITMLISRDRSSVRPIVPKAEEGLCQPGDLYELIHDSFANSLIWTVSKSDGIHSEPQWTLLCDQDDHPVQVDYVLSARNETQGPSWIKRESMRRRNQREAKKTETQGEKAVA
ncbi:hypothetical protein SISNIDRAFT_471697 [Sistotremastrum niveocremeum HHB9708]|uniref:Uncharacterized protein n=1 Tax=Sistotremastrum niveocremeum HHB9708 TaxID=1314777 RepID=A0A164MBK4_9AGAM|nr:hypothetical protein SISNIDRAFT_471697 [Sistotremastrum niveocremeum HHB9708]